MPVKVTFDSCSRSRCAWKSRLNSRVAAGLLVAIALACGTSANRAYPQDSKSGQDSPVHDSDRLYSIGAGQIVLENEHLSLAFDQHTGALVKFANKATGWQWQTEARLGESFILFVPTADRSYNPVLGTRNTLTSWR